MGTQVQQGQEQAAVIAQMDCNLLDMLSCVEGCSRDLHWSGPYGAPSVLFSKQELKAVDRE